MLPLEKIAYSNSGSGLKKGVEITYIYTTASGFLWQPWYEAHAFHFVNK